MNKLMKAYVILLLVFAIGAVLVGVFVADRGKGMSVKYSVTGPDRVGVTFCDESGQLISSVVDLPWDYVLSPAGPGSAAIGVVSLDESEEIQVKVYFRDKNDLFYSLKGENKGKNHALVSIKWGNDER